MIVIIVSFVILDYNISSICRHTRTGNTGSHTQLDKKIGMFMIDETIIQRYVSQCGTTIGNSLWGGILLKIFYSFHFIGKINCILWEFS